jgi:hypothetical protein
MRHRGHDSRREARAERPRLFHDAQQRMPPLGGPAAGAAPLLGAHDLLAQDFQLGIADRYQLGRLLATALAKNRPAFLEHFKHRKQMFV